MSQADWLIIGLSVYIMTPARSWEVVIALFVAALLLGRL